MPPPSLLASLPLIVLLPRFSVPPLRIPPPLLPLPLAELPANVLLRIVIVPLLKMAPPPNPPPELPVMVQLVTVAVPTLSIAPPVAESLAVNTQSVTVNMPCARHAEADRVGGAT